MFLFWRLRSAEAIGCHIVNIRPTDIQEGKEHLILAILWQTIQVNIWIRLLVALNKNN